MTLLTNAVSVLGRDILPVSLCLRLSKLALRAIERVRARADVRRCLSRVGKMISEVHNLCRSLGAGRRTTATLFGTGIRYGPVMSIAIGFGIGTTMRCDCVKGSLPCSSSACLFSPPDARASFYFRLVDLRRTRSIHVNDCVGLWRS
jgi:hypothetical protein